MNWKLTRSPAGEPRIVIRDADAQHCWGTSLLAEMARDDRTMVRLGDGVYEISKLPGRQV